MQISFQHVNPHAGHESTLLHVTPEGESRSTYLIDAGDSVSPHAFLGSDSALDGIFHTHAHSDHYESLGRILPDAGDCPLYTSPATAAILEQVHTEAAQHRDVGDVDCISDALTPIEGWTELSAQLDVCPVPAGHTPGATGFLFRVDDLDQNSETVMVLATGDFTTDPVAGYPELTVPDDIHIDVLFGNAATTENFRGEFAAALEETLERALGGATTVVATSGLAGIHTAYTLGHLVEELDRAVETRLVGQAAKLYDELDYEVPSVVSRPDFARPEEVLDPGAVTVAGPAEPTQGSTARLFKHIENDSGAAFVQLTPSEDAAVSGNCTTLRYDYSPHPTTEQFEQFVTDNLPRHLVLKHTGIDEAKQLGESFDDFFHWTNDDTQEHVLYEDGTWVGPEWISSDQQKRIKQRTYRASGPRMPLDDPREERPTVSLDRGAVDLEAEGIPVSDLASQFDTAGLSRSVHEPGPTDDGDGTTAGPDVVDELVEELQSELAVVGELGDRLDAVESKLADLERATATEETMTDGVGTVVDRLDTLDRTVDELSTRVGRLSSEPVTGTVVRNDELLLLQLDSEAVADIETTLEHGETVELVVESSDS